MNNTPKKFQRKQNRELLIHLLKEAVGAGLLALAFIAFIFLLFILG